MKKHHQKRSVRVHENPIANKDKSNLEIDYFKLFKEKTKASIKYE